ncbi:MAG: ATP-binding protein, partial [Anaerolineae bacterium]
DMPEELPALDADPTRVRQVLLNLLNNASRYTKVGGITVRVVPREEEVEIVVEDTGVGIPADQLSRIFEEFHQVDGSLRREHGGTGLGLAICKQFVTLHGGRIWAESEVGRGSAFHFTLPLPTKAVVPTQRSRLPNGWRHPAAKPAGPTRRLVTLGKPEEFSRFLRRYLTDAEVIDAASPEDAAQLARARQADAIVLPAESSSPDVTDWLASATAGASVPVLTCSLPLERHLALIEGFTHCLMKPFTASQLISVLQEVAPQARSVLVVDDNPGVLRLVRRSLAAAKPSMEILCASDGLSAIERLSAKPDVILLDLLLPKASGIQVLEAVREAGNGYNPPVVAITAYGFERDLSSLGQGTVAVRRGRSLSAAELARWIESTLDALPARHIIPVAE